MTPGALRCLQGPKRALEVGQAPVEPWQRIKANSGTSCGPSLPHRKCQPRTRAVMLAKGSPKLVAVRRR